MSNAPVDVKTAAALIKEAAEDSAGKIEHRSPFFFLVGAGISTPEIPLASEIEQHCREVAEQRQRAIEPPVGLQAISTYSHWFSKAYPHPIQRQNYLRRLIEGTRISQANFRLAHLLLESRLANLVVTPNFDDFLTRALNLFGKQHIVCDHPQTVQRIDPERRDLQVVHVHGTYWFYDCCNLTGEIADRAQHSNHSSFSMAALLDRIMSNRVPIVLGYSGWEGDAIMTALQRRLAGQRLPYNLYWFCYKASHVDNLPEWLTTHPDVFMVIPTSHNHDVNDLVGEDLPGMPSTTTSINGSSEPTLRAQVVLDELLRVFDMAVPELTRDPLAFFANYLSKSLPSEPKENEEPDQYFLSSVVEKIKMADELLQSQSKVESIDKKMEQVRNSVRRSQYGEAIRLAILLSGEEVTESQRMDLVGLVWAAATNLDDKSELQLHGWDLYISLAGTQISLDSRPDLATNVADAMRRRAIILKSLGRLDDAVHAYDEIIQRFASVPDPNVQAVVAKAFLNKGNAVARQINHAAARSVYQEALDRFETSQSLAVRSVVARILIGQALSYHAQGDYEAGLVNTTKCQVEFADVIDDYNASVAMYWKAAALHMLGRPLEAVHTLDEFLQRFVDSTDASIQEKCVSALHRKVQVLLSVGQPDSAKESYQTLVSRFGSAPESAIRKEVAASMIKYFNSLLHLGDKEEARRVLHSLKSFIDVVGEKQLEEMGSTLPQ